MEKEYIVKEINEYNIIIVNDEEYKLNIEFIDIEVNINDKLIICDSLFNKIKNNLSTFGKINSEYSTDLKKIDMSNILDEIIILKKDNREIYLKRLYG